MDDKIIICFCEDITRAEVRQTIKNGATTLDEIKRIIRCGMGPCQGKTCEEMICREIMDITGKKKEDILIPTRRPPTSSILLADAARSDNNEKTS